jgi:eukaryotic-like serine/threonine-protein kinase
LKVSPLQRTQLAHSSVPLVSTGGLTPPDAEVVEDGPGSADELAAVRNTPGRGSRAVFVGLALLGSAAGSVAGFQLAHQRNTYVDLSDQSGTVSVTIPRSWQREFSGTSWVPPGSEQDYPALSVGSGSDWRVPGSTKSGVFLAILPAEELPEQLPQHAECQRVEPVVEDVKKRGDVSRTVVSTDCPGVLVERVIQVTANRMLWVQVRSSDRSAANRVLDSVAVHGM